MDLETAVIHLLDQISNELEDPRSRAYAEHLKEIILWLHEALKHIRECKSLYYSAIASYEEIPQLKKKR